MGWYWWALIGWGVSGLIALAMEFRDKPAMRENVDWDDVWPVILGPFWLIRKMYDWFLTPNY